MFTAAKAAIMIASSGAELRHRDADDELADVLPSGDTIVRCPREIPISLDAIPDATDLHAMDLEAVRRSRQAKNLVNAAS